MTNTEWDELTIKHLKNRLTIKDGIIHDLKRQLKLRDMRIDSLTQKRPLVEAAE